MTGYAARTGVFEVMPISKEMRDLDFQRRTAREIRDQAIKEKMPEFRQTATAQSRPRRNQHRRSLPRHPHRASVDGGLRQSSVRHRQKRAGLDFECSDLCLH